MKRTRHLFILLFQAIAFLATAQKQNIRFERLGIDQGLSQSNVLCILQDSRGFMWFGTRDGLNKYDGYKFTIYKNDPGNPQSLSDNFITDMTIDQDGDLWVATKAGICRFDWKKNKFISYKNDPNHWYSISNNLTTSILEDSGGNMWVGTENGLNMLNRKENKFVRFTHIKGDSKSLSDASVRKIFEDSQNNLWICTLNGGLNLFDRTTRTFTSFQHNENDGNSISDNNIYTLFEDSRHRLWIGTNGGGLDLFDREKKIFRHYKHDAANDNSLPANSVYAINEDDQHNLWIGTENGGLSIFNPETGLFHTFQSDEANPSSISNNSIYAICKDTKHNMWIGTFNGGVNLVNPDGNKFAHYKHILNKNSLSNDNVLCIYEDSQKNIWIGTDGGGLNLFDPVSGRFTHFGHEKNNSNSICGDYVLGVCEDSKGNLWIGTWGDGITVFNRSKNTFRHFKNNPQDPFSVSGNNAWKIFEDNDKNIWIGAFGGGLNLFNPASETFTRYQHDENDPASLSNNNIYSIFEDSEKNLWISTDGGGLDLFDRKTKTFSHFVHHETRNSISNNTTGSICEDRNKNLWIGTGSGLSYFDKRNGRFTNYTMADGLPNNVIFGILEDSKGNIWISTNKGISRFDPDKKIFKNFGVSDGLQSNEFKIQAYCKSSNGTMYFGGNNGFNSFFPDSVKDRFFEPPLLITGFQIFNKEVPIADSAAASPLVTDISITKDITISYKSSVISFEFASLNYTTAEKKQYAYMLEGFDEKWNEIGTRRSVTYTNLDPGKYVFKIKGLNNDGSWSETITSLHLTITPPFWLTWWFKTAAAFFIISILFGFYRYRLNTVTRQKEKLEVLVKERTDEVVRQNDQMRKNVIELASLKEALEKEKYYFDSLMDHLPDAIYFKDTESRFMRVSKYMVSKHLAEHPGATINDLLGKTDFDIQDYVHAKEAYDDEQDIMRTGNPKIDYIEKELTNTGIERWVTTTKLPLLNLQGEVVGTFGVSKDITKIKMLEKQQHEAMLEKAVAQGKFEIASDVMHDIGNAVVGFGSYLTRIKRMQEHDHAEKLKSLGAFFEEQRTAITHVIGEAKTEALIKMVRGIAQTQINDQEEVSRIITEQLNIISHIQDILSIQRQYISGHEGQERKPVNMGTVINDCIAMLVASADKMGVQITTDIASDLPLIKGDRTKLMQLILNILKNSLEAIDRNAAEKTISVVSKVCDGKLFIQVTDNGQGLDASTIRQLFKKGFTTKSSSSGIGLYNCRIIAESHDGTINIESDGPGKGAATTVRLKIS